MEAGKRREQLPRRAARLGLREAPVRLRAQVLGKLAAVHTFEDENGAIALRYKLEQRHGSQVQRRSEAAVHGGLVLGLLRVEFCVPRASCLAATMLHHLDGDLASIRSVRQVDRAEAAAPQPVDELVTRYRGQRDRRCERGGKSCGGASCGGGLVDGERGGFHGVAWLRLGR